MRIGFFVWEYPPRLVGGLGTYAEYMTRAFVELGHEVTVFTLNPGDLKTHEVWQGVDVHRPLIADASNVFPLFVADDLRRWGTNIRFFSDIFLYNVLSATKFVNQLIKNEGYDFDIVCVHDWLSSVAGIIIKNETTIPVAFHVHSTEWGRSGGPGSDVVTHLESAMAHAADRVLTVSHVMREDLTRHGWPESRISVVWNGVDPERYDPHRYRAEEIERLRSRYRVDADERMLFFLGRLTWVKGVMNLLQAMPLIVRDYPRTKLVILGKGEEQTDLVETVSRLGLTDRVICRFEFIPEDERILHYAAADVCVFPSVYEPFGLVSLEAMSMAKPVVVGAHGVVGFREQVIPSGSDQNGVHVNGSDPADIAWGVEAALTDPSRARRWGEAGRSRVLRYFTWTRVAEHTLRLYQGLHQDSTT